MRSYWLVFRKSFLTKVGGIYKLTHNLLCYFFSASCSHSLSISFFGRSFGDLNFLYFSFISFPLSLLFYLFLSLLQALSNAT